MCAWGGREEQVLKDTRLKLLTSEGSDFHCVDISEVSELSEAKFCKWLTTEVGVAAIPHTDLKTHTLMRASSAPLMGT